ADNWAVMLAIADAAGGEWPARAHRAAKELAGLDDATDDDAVTLLADLRDLFGRTDRLTSAHIVASLGAREDRPWAEGKHGKPITVRQVAALVRRFGVTPGTIKLPNGDTAKGYYAAS